MFAAILGIAVTNPGVATSMTMVDPLVITHLESAGGRSIPVLIVCDESCSSVVAALEREGIHVTNIAGIELGSIGASITRDQLDRMRSIPGIDAVEYDQDVGIFRSD
jgi:hypothetical protein